ncbi:MAG: YraN family protein [Bacteroidetes bacterium]|jgi:putative endonuclease|nr:YraN family protein [Bacteroidota bacterium]
MNTKHIGDHGEELAAAYLSEAGYRILDRNYRYERAEIDLVCFDATEQGARGRIVFVEVKTRSGLGFGAPEEAVTDEKQDHVIHAAKAYLYERQLEGAPVRFDVISVLLNQDRPPDIDHYKGAFWSS